jgi:hypothetical protein
MTTLLRTDFDDFLFASIGDDAAGAPMTLLTALARLDVDAWEEAADLARLPHEAAAQKLAALLATVPNCPAPGESVAIATRLVALLHRAPKRPARPAEAPPASVWAAHARSARPRAHLVIASIIIVALIFFFAWR